MILKLAWSELKLFVREPLTALFVLALPLVLLYTLGGVFGNGVDADAFRGVRVMEYYVPAYVALVVASLTLVSLPTHVASYREEGVLRRLQASGLASWVLPTAQALVAVVLGAAGSLLVVLGAAPVYGIAAPHSLLRLVVAFAVVAVAFAAVGVSLGIVASTARAAQAIGMLVWFVLMLLGGAGPPREILTSDLRRVQDATPLWHAVKSLQDAWLGLDAGLSWLVLLAILALGLATAALVFRLE